jgi:GTP-binding protein
MFSHTLLRAQTTMRSLRAMPSLASLRLPRVARRTSPRRGFGSSPRSCSAGEMLGASPSEWTVSSRPIRNIAVVAHVDHGKTSLVDCLLKESGELGDVALGERVMDSNDIERERGITILAKCTSFHWGDENDKVLFNIVDTPGHADFGGEVERVLHMVDAVLLVVCAHEGPMPQTRFVLSKALAKGLSPFVVVNKADRPDSRIGEVESEILDLLIALDASEEQLDCPIWYASARDGWVSSDPGMADRTSMGPLLDALRQTIPPPKVLGRAEDPFRMLVSQIDVDPYVGKLVLGRVASGSVKVGDKIRAVSLEGAAMEEGSVTKMRARRGTKAVDITSAEAGDVVEIAGLQKPDPTDTVCSTDAVPVLPLFADPIDPPTLSMAFAVNDSPLAGKEGNKLTSAQLQKRLLQEAIVNVGIRVESAPAMEGMSEAMSVSGRGELQMAVLIENMRREGFELSVSPPRVVFRDAPDGSREEPYEEVQLDVPEAFAGKLMELMLQRRGEMKEYVTGADSVSRLRFVAPSRALLGFQSEFRSETKGQGVMNRSFHGYGPYNADANRVRKGAIISTAQGTATAYALEQIEPRGVLFIKPQTDVYEGMVIGEHSRELDLEVNPVRAKKLTNIRAASAEEFSRLSPPRVLTLEDALTWIGDDELLEVTPTVIRCRKQILSGNSRKIAERNSRV